MSSFRTLILILLSAVVLITTLTSAQQAIDSIDLKNSTLGCFFEEDTVECAAKRIDQRMDEIQNEESMKSGVSGEPPVSQVISETRQILGEGIQTVKTVLGLDGETEGAAVQEEELEDSQDNGEARKKKFGKKKKKALQKILMLAMVLKAKLSLLLQLFSAHLQVKFFIVALLSLILNAARLWISFKKGDHPSKVIYYEHAQHQHHYDHEDDHSGGYWGRSSDDAQDLAYNHYNNQE